MNKILQIYKTLLKKYDKQGWWPVTSRNGIKPEYFQEISTNKQRFEIIIGAILTQNTSWKNVEKAIINLNKNRLIDVKKINKIDLKKLAEIIKPSGYYNQKAIKLKNFSNFLLKKYNGNLKKFFHKNIIKLRNELLSINGIGPETADSIILYAAEKPIFVVDAYTKRIFQRIGYNFEKYDEFQKLFMKNLDTDVGIFKEYHALIVELGKNVCVKEPKCAECPINSYCNYFQNFELNNK